MITQIQNTDINNPFNMAYEQYAFSGTGATATYTFTPTHVPANNLSINQAYVWSPNDNIIVPQPNYIVIATMDHVVNSMSFGIYVSGSNICLADIAVRGPNLQNGTPYLLVVSYLY